MTATHLPTPSASSSLFGRKLTYTQGIQPGLRHKPTLTDQIDGIDIDMCTSPAGAHPESGVPGPLPDCAQDGVNEIQRTISSLAIGEFTGDFLLEDCAGIAGALTSGLASGIGLYGNEEDETAYYERWQQMKVDVAAAQEAESERLNNARATAAIKKEPETEDSDAIDKPQQYTGKKRKFAALDEAEDPGEVLGDFERPRFNAEYVEIGEDEYLHTWHYFSGEWEQHIHDLYNVQPMVKPPDMLDDPHPWQLKGAAQAHFSCESRFRAFMCGDGMGLGKTLLGVLAMWMVKDEPGISLVVAPKSVCYQWEQTINNAFQIGSEMRAFLLDDPQISAQQLHAGGYDVVIVSYEFLECNLRPKYYLPEDIDAYLKNGRMGVKPRKSTCALHSAFWMMNGLPFKRVLLDEAQKVNKTGMARHKAVKELFYKAVIMLSGTLAHNQWHDCAGLVAFVQSHPFTTYNKFMAAFSTKDYTGRIILDPNGRSVLQRFLQAFLIARPSSILTLKGLRRKRACFNLYSKEAADVNVFMEKYHQMLAIASNAGPQIDAIDSDFPSFGTLQRAHLASIHPLFAKFREDVGEDEYDPENNDPDGDYVDVDTKRSPVAQRQTWLAMVADRRDLLSESARLVTLVKLYNWLRKEYPDEKIVIFSQYLRFLDIVDAALKQQCHIQSLRYDGTVSHEQRKKVRLEYDSCDPGIPLLMTSGAGSVGLNITTASIVIQTEPWWNGNNEIQAICRAYRQHQSREVKAIMLFGANSAVDKYILRLRNRKLTTISELMEPLIRGVEDKPDIRRLQRIPNERPYEFTWPKNHKK